jgi:hypothetical protein
VRDIFSQPQWDGSSLAGKTVLIHAEQSSAEEVLFASCYSDLLEQAAGCVILCEPRLQRLFERSYPRARFAAVPRGSESQLKAPSGTHIDLQIAAGSLPLHCRTTLEKFPQRRAYLTADPARTEAWRRRYAALGPGMNIGIAWRDPDANFVARHQEPERSDLRPLLALPGVHWINLLDSSEARRGSADMAIDSLAKELGTTVHHWPQPEIGHDLDDLAARLAAVDLVIAVGGLPAHLAGALGVPACVLAAPSDWHWLATGSSAGDLTPWYPALRLFRPDPDGWRGPIVRLGEELLKRGNIRAD